MSGGLIRIYRCFLFCVLGLFFPSFFAFAYSSELVHINCYQQEGKSSNLMRITWRKLIKRGTRGLVIECCQYLLTWWCSEEIPYLHTVSKGGQKKNWYLIWLYAIVIMSTQWEFWIIVLHPIIIKLDPNFTSIFLIFITLLYHCLEIGIL